MLAKPNTTAALGLQTLSGFAALGYEIVWTQQLGVALGHEYVAVLAVLAAFFGGVAVGALALAKAIERSLRPALWYAACEGAIAVWALLLSWLLPGASTKMAAWLGPQPSSSLHWAVAFVGPLLLLLPATCAMGATLPAIERVVGPGARGAPTSAIASLYAANTFGAVLGVLVCALWLVPELGLAHTARVCAALNGLAAVAALFWFGSRRSPLRDRAEPNASSSPRLVLSLTATGLLGIGYEVLGVRVISQITENTIYTFAFALAAILLGTALGGFVQRRLVSAEHELSRERLLLTTAGTCLLGLLSLSLGRPCQQTVSAWLRDDLGAAHAALTGEAVVALAALLLPSIAMGALFSQLCLEARRASLALGTAMAANTAGAAAAPFLFGVLVLPALGARVSLLGVVSGYLLLMRPQLGARLAREPRWLVGAAVMLIAVLASPTVGVEVPDGGRLIAAYEGVSAQVSVVQDAQGVSTLHINNRQQEGSSATLLADARQAWLPLLLHGQPERALFLGLGTGMTSGSASWDPELTVEAVELLPEVVEASAFFTPALHATRMPHVQVTDARRFVRSAGRGYDVIVADLFQPARSGAAALYTREHFAAVRARLQHDGLFCQWLPLHQLELETLRSIVLSFLSVYPDARLLLATNSLDTPVIGLLAARDGLVIEPARVRERLARLAAPARLDQLHLEDELAVLGSFVAGPAALARFARGAELNTDDRPIVAQRAPLLTYGQTGSPRARLLALLSELHVEPGDVLPPAVDLLLAQRLSAYFVARDRFLRVGTEVRPTSNARAMLAQVREPLLQILRGSPDFRPAYDPLFNMARALTSSAPPEARSLLAALSAAQPARPEAGLLLESLAQTSAVP